MESKLRAGNETVNGDETLALSLPYSEGGTQPIGRIPPSNPTLEAHLNSLTARMKSEIFG